MDDFFGGSQPQPKQDFNQQSPNQDQNFQNVPNQGISLKNKNFDEFC